MKLKFKTQQFQTDAVEAVADLFKGQEKLHSTFEITNIEQEDLVNKNEFGVGNRVSVSNDALIFNMNEIQKRNNLPQTNDIVDKNGAVNRSFCIEMETGTGKTYVYTKTIFELNKRYGFTKFIIVVPSVAIREGVYKSFEVTREHFQNAYSNVPYRYFIYNSARLSDVRQFATSNNIEIMIINIDAFKKAENIINQAQDRLNGETAMRYIQDTAPIVIIDEPQSVDNTDKAKEALASLNPSCVLRYSATHREKLNLLYRLTPVDAYRMGLVKQICVSSNAAADDFNKPYVKLKSVSNDSGFKAKIELDVNAKGVVSRKTVTVKPNDDLFLLSGERELYDGYVVSGIDCTPGFECVEFSNTERVALGKAIGSIDENIIKEAQIRRTIQAHLDKELQYTEKGIKVLSLFFIDEVKKYRTADGEKGIYAQMFESCYNELINSPKYESLKPRFPSDVSAIHNGYFSQDKKGAFKDTKGDTAADYDTYNTIMKDKEWLLSYDCPLRFIFSHSALKEGWDNPNVFQICTLIDQKSIFTCRQKVGRGLRLCVNQDGERVEDKNINVLHVMANESFAEFTENLQKEIETETGVKFGALQIGLFSGMKYTATQTVEKTITQEQAEAAIETLKQSGVISNGGKVEKKPEEIKKIEIPKELDTIKDEVIKAIETTGSVNAETLTGTAYTETVWVEKEVTYEEAAELLRHFEDKGYIAKSGKIKDTMKNALLSGTLDLPKKFEAARERLESIVKKADNKLPVRDASKEVVVRIKKQALLSPEFMELWDKIKQKTAYRVQIDTEKLVENCVKELKSMPAIPKAHLVSQTAEIDIQSHGVTYTEREFRTTSVSDTYSSLPYILGVISEETLIKKSTAARIIIESGRARDFLNNPQAFTENCLEIIKHNRHALAIDGIKYVKRDGQEYYVQEIFDSAELAANLDKNAVAVNRSIYDYIIYDSSTIEKPFALALDNDPDVKMFFKIPDRFKIETPIGTYNPDWAVLWEKNGEQKLYFIIETKGSSSLFDLRTPEQLKIHCGIEHFKALDNGAGMFVATEWNKFKLGH